MSNRPTGSKPETSTSSTLPVPIPSGGTTPSSPAASRNPLIVVVHDSCSSNCSEEDEESGNGSGSGSGYDEEEIQRKYEVEFRLPGRRSPTPTGCSGPAPEESSSDDDRYPERDQDDADDEEAAERADYFADDAELSSSVGERRLAQATGSNYARLRGRLSSSSSSPSSSPPTAGLQVGGEGKSPVARLKKPEGGEKDGGSVDEEGDELLELSGRNWGSSAVSGGSSSSALVSSGGGSSSGRSRRASSVSNDRVEGPSTSSASTRGELCTTRASSASGSATKYRKRRATLAVLDQLSPFASESSPCALLGQQQRAVLSTGTRGASFSCSNVSLTCTPLLTPEQYVLSQKQRASDERALRISRWLQKTVTGLVSFLVILICSTPPTFKTTSDEAPNTAEGRSADGHCGESAATSLWWWLSDTSACDDSTSGEPVPSLQLLSYPPSLLVYWLCLCLSISTASAILFLVLHHLSTTPVASPVDRKHHSSCVHSGGNGASAGVAASTPVAGRSGSFGSAGGPAATGPFTRKRVCESLEKFTFVLIWSGFVLDLALHTIYLYSSTLLYSAYVNTVCFTFVATLLHFARIWSLTTLCWRWNSHKFFWAILRSRLNHYEELASSTSLAEGSSSGLSDLLAHFYSFSTLKVLLSLYLIVVRRIGWALLASVSAAATPAGQIHEGTSVPLPLVPVSLVPRAADAPLPSLHGYGHGGASLPARLLDLFVSTLSWNSEPTPASATASTLQALWTLCTLLIVIVVPYACTLVGLIVARVLIAQLNGTSSGGSATGTGTVAGTTTVPGTASAAGTQPPASSAPAPTASPGLPAVTTSKYAPCSSFSHALYNDDADDDSTSSFLQLLSNQHHLHQPTPSQLHKEAPSCSSRSSDTPRPHPPYDHSAIPTYTPNRRSSSLDDGQPAPRSELSRLSADGSSEDEPLPSPQTTAMATHATTHFSSASAASSSSNVSNSNTLLLPSTAASKMRRTSLPAALPVQRQLTTTHHGGVDTAILLEAHGLVTDMLLDQAALPAHIVAGLKALATLLTPPLPSASGIHYQSYSQLSSLKPRPAPLTLSIDPDYTSDIDEIPYTGEKISSMPKRNSGPATRKGVSANVLRRMSTSTWTTTTSATGMPTLEPQPNSRRRRSASFRSAMDQQQGGVGGQQQQPGDCVAGLTQQHTGFHPRSYHSVAALHASHKSRSFSTNALFASSESRRRFSHHEFASASCAASVHACSTGARKTVCSLHPLSPSDVSYLNRIVQDEGGEGDSGRGGEGGNSGGEGSKGVSSASSSPQMTPYPSPIPSPKLLSRESSPSNYVTSFHHFYHANRAQRASIPSPSTSHPAATVQRQSSCHQMTPGELEALTILNNSSSDRSLSPGSFPSGGANRIGGGSAEQLGPDNENCSTASTFGDSPATAHATADFEAGAGNAPSAAATALRLSPVIFTVHEPPEDHVQSQSTSSSASTLKQQYSAAAILDPGTISIDEEGPSTIVTPDGCKFDLLTIANEPVLCRLNEWDYPIFDLEEISQTQILSHMCYKIFLDVGLFENFKIPIKEFINYFHALEMGYRDKPYHNRMHAADVLHGVYYFTSQPIPGFEMLMSDPETPCAADAGSNQRAWFSVDESSAYGVMGANFPALELMALYTAAAMHDYDHPGRTNAFLVTTHAPQAILYNDRSVLENHHAAAAWSLLLNTENCNFLKFLDKAEFKRFRYLVIEAILATDLKRHFEILAEFNAKVNEEDSQGIDWTQEADRLLVMEMCIKLADINGPCKFHDIHVRWTYRIAEEFYEQGDEEAELGLPISPYMDREHPQLAKLQESFINHLVAPLCEACAKAGLLPGLYWDEDDEEGGGGGGEAGSGGATGETLTLMTNAAENEPSLSSCPETDNEGDSSYSDDLSNVDPTKSSSRIMTKRKILCLQTKHLQDNHKHWMAVIKEETRRREEGLRATTQESVPSINTTEDLMETIEEENNTPHSLNRSFSFEKEDSKL